VDDSAGGMPVLCAREIFLNSSQPSLKWRYP